MPDWGIQRRGEWNNNESNIQQKISLYLLTSLLSFWHTGILIFHHPVILFSQKDLLHTWMGCACYLHDITDLQSGLAVGKICPEEC